MNLKLKSIAKIPLAEQLHGKKVSPVKNYRDKVFDDRSALAFLRYEAVLFFCGDMPGSLGYLLRRRLYAKLFARLGRQVIFGRGIALRQPGRMILGNRVAIDDFVLLDASGSSGQGLVLRDNVIVSRNSVIQGKTGPILIDEHSDIGCNVVLSSTSGIYIGRSVLIASNCYIGGGRYRHDRVDVPMKEQGLCSRGAISIDDDVWLGAGVIVLDGVSIGKGCIIGAGSVVTGDIPPYSVAVGMPARVIRKRGREDAAPKREGTVAGSSKEEGEAGDPVLQTTAIPEDGRRKDRVRR
jgi:acetyltransferase-like isoleucine patch superfamily enzyme